MAQGDKRMIQKQVAGVGLPSFDMLPSQIRILISMNNKLRSIRLRLSLDNILFESYPGVLLSRL
jgi:hypothetical protein